jgi:GT2 family glycosyltransferase
VTLPTEPAAADADDPGSPLAGSRPRVDAVVVAYGPEEWLERSVTALLASEGVDVSVLLVDNGGTEGEVDRLEKLDGVTVVRPGSNVGFASGCNLGVEAGSSPFVALVNPDAIVEPRAIAELVAVAGEPDVGIATASVRLADDPDLLNSGGNMVHYLGMSWSGSFNEPAADHDERRPAAAASGCALACRRERWEALGGFCDEFFAYYEDADLSLRSWQRGWQVIYVPTAVVVHRYEFSRNPLKFKLLEKNRLIMLLSCFSGRHLLLTAPLLFGLELGTLALGAKQGWLKEKLASYVWLLQHVRWLARRRRAVQAASTVRPRDLTHLYSAQLDPANLDLPAVLQPINKVLAAYWRVVRPLI